MNNAIFGKAMENVRIHRDIKLVTTEIKKKLFGVRTKLSYHKVFHNYVLTMEMKKTEILINKPVCLGLLVLALSNQKIVKTLYCVIWIQIVSLYTQKQMIFIKILQKMFKLGLILQIIN